MLSTKAAMSNSVDTKKKKRKERNKKADGSIEEPHGT